MNTSRPHVLSIRFINTPAVTLVIAAGTIRRNGVAPLLTKSVRAQMSARATAA